MQSHYNYSDTQFIHLLDTCELDPSIFSHEAHLRLAWIHIKNKGIAQAIETVQNQIKNYVEHLGVIDKYNTTLTVAATKAVYHFMLKSQADSFKDFIEEFPRLKYNFKELMAYHYVFDIYNLEQAKTKFLEPDLLPFD